MVPGVAQLFKAASVEFVQLSAVVLQRSDMPFEFSREHEQFVFHGAVLPLPDQIGRAHV